MAASGKRDYPVTVSIGAEVRDRPAASAPANSPTDAPPPPASRAPSSPLTPGLAPAPVASLRLPGEHFAAALCFLTLGACGVVWIAPELAGGVYFSPRVAGVTHLFTLGWLTMAIFGAIYQLLPVALGAPVHSEWMGHASFATFAPGVAVFALAVMRDLSLLRYVGAALLATGIVLLVTNVALSLPVAQRQDVTWAALAIAISFLSATLLVGALLVHNLHTGLLARARFRVLATHLHLALLGWVFVMIVGMSHRLLPMFLVAHGADTRWTSRSLVLLVPGVLTLATGLIASLIAFKWIGLILLEAAVACFLIQARLLYRSRLRPSIDAGLKHAAIALVSLSLAAVLAPEVLVLGFTHPRLDMIYVVLGLLGAFTLYVVGFFYRVVPFLAWITRFRTRMGRESVPTVAQLYSSRAAHIELGLYAAAIIALVCGIAGSQPAVIRVGGVLLAGAVGLFVSQMAHAMRGEPYPAGRASARSTAQ